MHQSGRGKHKSKKASIKATPSANPASKGTREATNAKTQISRLMQPTVSSRSKTRTKGEMSVESRSVKRHNSRLMRRIERLKNKVHQAMAVMGAETGKRLNYKQLLKDPKYKKKWSTSPEKLNASQMELGVGQIIQLTLSNSSGKMRCPRTDGNA